MVRVYDLGTACMCVEQRRECVCTARRKCASSDLIVGGHLSGRQHILLCRSHASQPTLQVLMAGGGSVLVLGLCHRQEEDSLVKSSCSLAVSRPPARLARVWPAYSCCAVHTQRDYQRTLRSTLHRNPKGRRGICG